MDPGSLKKKQLEIDNRIRDVYRQKVALKSISVITRNVVLIGRSRSGKSTFKKMLVNPTLVTADMTIFSDTKQASVQSFLMYAPDSFDGDSSAVSRNGETNDNHSIPVVLNVMDTPGLSEKSESGAGRSDQELLDIIGKALNKEMNQYHAIFLCTSLESGSNKDDLEAFMKFRGMLGDNVRDHMCLVITRCESKTSEQQNELLNQMKQLKEYNNMLDYFKGGIFFSGALDFDAFNLANSTEIERQFQAVINMRRKLFEFIVKKEVPINVMNLNMSDVQRILKEQKQLAQKITQLEQFGGSKAKEVDTLKTELANKTCTVM